MKRLALALAAAAAVTASAHDASAFCGFYVSGSGQKLANDATQVVMMREGTRTALTMQNDYRGPPEKFAMIVPVPVVLQKDNVKTLPMDVFTKIEELDAPRLVEYWEQDPCAPSLGDAFGAGGLGLSGVGEGGGGRGEGLGLGVKVEARFSVGEYEIVILSAKDSTGLDTWLKQEKYTIPDGAEPVLRPYVAAGMKFFVAKVDPAKVKFENGHAALSPLRFHYDADAFSLPVRLGLLNSSGTQDLIIHVIGKGKRYEAANYPNVTIPTNLDVADATRDQFAAFYAALFDRTAETNPKAVVTEYAWDAGNCDPCPGPPLDAGQVATFGGDVMPTRVAADTGSVGAGGAFGYYGGVQGYVLTRLHMRYGKDTLGDDIVFREAKPITGGRESFLGFRGDDGGALSAERGSKPSSQNNFQARYVIRHAWTGPLLCDHPVRGLWGGPPQPDASLFPATSRPRAATKLAFAPRGQLQLASFVTPAQVPELSLLAAVPVPTAAPSASGSGSDAGAAQAKPKTSGCLGCTVGGGGEDTPLLLGGAGFALLAVLRRYHRRRET